MDGRARGGMGRRDRQPLTPTTGVLRTIGAGEGIKAAMPALRNPASGGWSACAATVVEDRSAGARIDEGAAVRAVPDDLQMNGSVVVPGFDLGADACLQSLDRPMVAAR